MTIIQLAPGETQRPSGLVVPAPAGRICGVIFPYQGPANIMVETADVIRARLRDATGRGVDMVLLHELSFGGHAVWYKPDYIAGIGVTFKELGRVTPGTIFNGDCPCELCVAARAPESESGG